MKKTKIGKKLLGKTMLEIVATALFVAGVALFVPQAVIKAQAASITVNDATELTTALQNASSDANNPTEIVIGGDFDGADLDVSLYKHALIDLNGKTIGVSETSYILGSLTIIGTGTINLGNDIQNNGEFRLSGGTINYNVATKSMYNFGTFLMTGGKIIHDPSLNGGGDLINNYGTFTMEGGEIESFPGSIFLTSGGTFNMKGGTITQTHRFGGLAGSMDNYAVSGSDGTFTQSGGTINGSLFLNNISFTQTGGANTANLSITLDSNGGTPAMASATTVTTSAGQKLYALPAAPTAPSANLSFAGWFTDATAGTQITTDYVFTGATTIYAHWTNGSVSSPVSATLATPNTTSETTTSEDTPSTTIKDFLEELEEKFDVAIKAGGPQTIYLNGVATLPITIMRKLRDNPQLTVVLDFTYDNVSYLITIPGKSVVVDDTIPWYGPLYLNAHYGQYSTPAPHANAATAPANGTYSVANGDTLSAIASRLRTTVRHLVEVNHITDPDRISIGQRLTY